MKRPTAVRNIIHLRKLRKVKANEQRNNNRKKSRAHRKNKLHQK